MVTMECSSSLDMKCTVASEQAVLWGIGLSGQGEEGAKRQRERLLRLLARTNTTRTKGKPTDIALLRNKVKLTITEDVFA